MSLRPLLIREACPCPTATKSASASRKNSLGCWRPTSARVAHVGRECEPLGAYLSIRPTERPTAPALSDTVSGVAVPLACQRRTWRICETAEAARRGEGQARSPGVHQRRTGRPPARPTPADLPRGQYKLTPRQRAAMRARRRRGVPSKRLMEEYGPPGLPVFRYLHRKLVQHLHSPKKPQLRKACRMRPCTRRPVTSVQRPQRPGTKVQRVSKRTMSTGKPCPPPSPHTQQPVLNSNSEFWPSATERLYGVSCSPYPRHPSSHPRTPPHRGISLLHPPFPRVARPPDFWHTPPRKGGLRDD